MSQREPFQVGNVESSDISESGSCLKSLTPLKWGIIIGGSVLTVGIIIVIAVAASGGSSKKKVDEDPNNISLNFKENEGPLGNPLKGFAPWETSRDLHVPCSLEFVQLKMFRIYENESYINTTYLEKELQKVASRKRHAIVRFVCDDPGSEDVVPVWFMEKAKKHNYTRKNVTYQIVDFNDDYVLDTLEDTINELGKFDGDPRIGFWQLGTYGHWGVKYINNIN